MTVTRTVVIVPPAEMLADCPRPPVDVSTNRGLSESLLAAHQQIVECNRVRATARKYINDARKRAAADVNSQ